MAQILETEGILVSLSLLNGVPSTLLNWTSENIILNDNINTSLLSRYLKIDCEVRTWLTTNLIYSIQFSNSIIYLSLILIFFYLDELQMAKKFSSQCEWDANINQLLQSNNILEIHDVRNTLNMIQSQINTLIKLEPLSNKLLSIPQVFISNELSDMSLNALNEVSHFNMTEIIINWLIIARHYFYRTVNFTNYWRFSYIL